MITLTANQKAIASQIIKMVFGAVRNVNQIVGLRVYGETVEIVTTDSLWTMGLDYFKQLVTQFKAATKPHPKQEVKAAAVQQPTGLKAGTVLLGDRIVTTGNYVGQARINSISMARMGTKNKIAMLELMKAGVSREEAIGMVLGSRPTH